MGLLKLSKTIFAIIMAILFTPSFVQNESLTAYAVSCTTPGGYTGTCLNRSTTSCSGYYNSNYCSGSNQCCITTVVKCTTPSGTGVCHNSSGANANPCTGGHYVSGYCPGPNDVRCCVGATAPAPNPPAPTTTRISFNNLLLHGIGKAGDSVNEGEAGGGTIDPKHPEREITVNIYDSQNIKTTQKGKVNFDSGLGGFKTLPGKEIDIGSLPTGSYVVEVKFSQSTITKIGQFQTITAGIINPIHLIRKRSATPQV